MKGALVRRNVRRHVLAMVVATTVAGCGGEEWAATPQSARACLETAGARASTDADDLDYIAQDAGVGAVYADFGRQSATVVFERSEADIEQTEGSYKLFGVTDGYLDKHGSIMVVWDRPPKDEERTTVEACLEG
jgi:hypothetical protein